MSLTLRSRIFPAALVPHEEKVLLATKKIALRHPSDGHSNIIRGQMGHQRPFAVRDGIRGRKSNQYAQGCQIEMFISWIQYEFQKCCGILWLLVL